MNADERLAVWRVAAYLYNVAPAHLAEALFPNAVPMYQDEWTERFVKGFGYAVSKMDDNTFARFCGLAETHTEGWR